MTARGVDTYTVGRVSGPAADELPSSLWLAPGSRSAAGPAREPDAGTRNALALLAAAEVRLEVRVADPLGTHLCLGRSGETTVRAVRRGATLTVDFPHCDGTAVRLYRLVEAALPEVWGAERCATACFPTEEGVEVLSCDDASRMAAGLRSLAVPAAAASRLAHVLTRAETAVECTLEAAGRPLRSTVAVIDAPVGRVVATTAPAADGRLWTAVAEGSAHRIGLALRRACEELPGGAWLP
ncbi:ESX secretion-associated protein EspG [Tsukamurella sp. 8F]|uniref:ESX secretion-associated protein EspG n=1 Tax=unclassified Tsukamurella TaxID=2633480 RepID=UPI0023B899CA|nr:MULTISPECIES: ESX secretion-associated protein EspG [unclassified Tsukamurella]MDF0531748.1 ESX secretion-associated protein EspG [Tsukamurella sp. 8J]MDF0589538.1 ESX secretion-associated protein EspG [Tsukamurella sp. 8F]